MLFNTYYYVYIGQPQKKHAADLNCRLCTSFLVLINGSLITLLLRYKYTQQCLLLNHLTSQKCT